MKKLLATLLILIMSVPCALAAPQTIDLETMTLEELQELDVAVEAAIKAAQPAVEMDDVISGEDTSRDTPAPIGQTVLYDGGSYYNESATEITISKVVRGDAAWSIIKGFNRYNSKPAKGSEYIIAYVDTKVPSDEDKAASISEYYFSFVSAKGVEYQNAFVMDAQPTLQNVYPGSENTGIVIAEIPKDDKPMLVYLKEYDTPMWFDLNRRKPIVLPEDAVLNPLKKGDKGDEVLEMQSMLAELGYLKVAPDGDYGNKTVEAIKAYQKDMGVEATGAADEATLRMILTLQAPN